MTTMATRSKSTSARSRKRRTILVTGATGFVGRHVVRAAHEQGDRVRVLVRATSDLSPIEGCYDEKHVGDLQRPETLEGCCDGVDAVVHSACAVAGTFDAGRAALEHFMAVNRDGTVNMANEVLKHPGLRMVHVSSTAAMGPPQTTVIDEESPCNPKAPYQRSKRAAEEALLGLHAESGLDVVMIRPCVVSGAGKDNSELLKLFRLVKRGVFPYLGRNLDVQKPLIHIDDLVQALLLATDAGRAGEIYLVHSGGRHTMGEILQVAGELTGARRTHVHVPLPVASLAASVFSLVNKVAPDWNAPLTHDRIRLFVADRRIDIGKAQRELGYEPKVTSVRAILEDTYRYHAGRGDV